MSPYTITIDTIKGEYTFTFWGKSVADVRAFVKKNFRKQLLKIKNISPKAP